MMKKVLFMIHDLGQGGAEKVLVNLVNNMDKNQFSVTVIALFGGGANERFLKPHVRYHVVFPKSVPGNSHLMKLLTPYALHKLFVKEQYDVEVSYLEGPSSRIISGCNAPNTKLVSWIHSDQATKAIISKSFRNFREAETCYKRFDRIVAVSETIKQHFLEVIPVYNSICVLYNTNESEYIKHLALDQVDEGSFHSDEFKLVGVGKLVKNKGFDRLLRVVKRLVDDKSAVHLYLLGNGPDAEQLRWYVAENGLQNSVSFLGYQVNPYKYVSKCDLFVCSSFSEGFSTAATEALIVGTPVCTVAVSGMKEMLGENNEYGVITENDEVALYEGIKRFVESPETLEYYKKKAKERGECFSTKSTVRAVEEMLLSL